jgi:parallel beta-helix repeat protein
MSSPNTMFNSSTTVSAINAAGTAFGIYLWYSSNAAFSSNAAVSDVNGNQALGILVGLSDNTSFSSNTSVSSINAIEVALGIILTGSHNNTFSSKHSVSYLNATDEVLGIFLSGSDDNEFHNCTISNLTAGNETYGVFMADASTNNTVSDGEVRDTNHGIRVENSSNNTIQRNMIVNNTGGATGLNVTDGSDGNTIEQNCFIDNIPQARDDGSQNVWNGNYWSDYTGPGSYTIGGAAGSRDDNPLDDCPVEPTPPKPPPAHFRYLHSTSGLFNLTAPVGTQWHELWPIFCREYHLSSWNDTGGDGVLSRCDRIDMYQKPDGEVRWYHVEEVTITLNVTHNETGEPMYIELEGGYNASVLTNPVDTQWHEVYPNFCNRYHLSAWATDNGGKLGYCDYIDLTDKATGEVTMWHVEEVAVDIIVTIEPPPVGGEAYPINKISLLAPWIAVAVLLAGGTSWYVLRRRRAQS